MNFGQKDKKEWSLIVTQIPQKTRYLHQDIKNCVVAALMSYCGTLLYTFAIRLEVFLIALQKSVEIVEKYLMMMINFVPEKLVSIKTRIGP